MTNLATIIAHADVTDLERAILNALESSPRAGTSADLAELFGVTSRSLFRTLAGLESDGLVERETLTGRHGSMVIRLKGDAVDKLRRLCHSLGRPNERPGAEYTRPMPGSEESVRSDRARMVEAKRARQAALLGNTSARSSGQG